MNRTTKNRRWLVGLTKDIKGNNQKRKEPFGVFGKPTASVVSIADGVLRTVKPLTT